MELEKVYMRGKNDCYSACLATLLRKRIEDVPVFISEDNCDKGFNGLVEEYLNSVGLRRLVLNTFGQSFLNGLKGYHIVSGPSKNPEFKSLGWYHAVIYKDGKLWHDPNPEPHEPIEPTEVDFLIYSPDLSTLSF